MKTRPWSLSSSCLPSSLSLMSTLPDTTETQCNVFKDLQQARIKIKRTINLVLQGINCFPDGLEENVPCNMELGMLAMFYGCFYNAFQWWLYKQNNVIKHPLCIVHCQLSLKPFDFFNNRIQLSFTFPQIS